MSKTMNDGVTLRAGTQARRIPEPDDARPPLKSNVFKFAAGIASQLQPMFPYESAGNLVPCVAVMQGIDGGHYGHFFHWNSVEEIAVVFGSRNGMLATGVWRERRANPDAPGPGTQGSCEERGNISWFW